MGLKDVKKEKEVKPAAKSGSNKHYLTGKEVRAIAKANAVEMRRLEKEKYRRADPSEYTSQMKDPNNI